MPHTVDALTRGVLDELYNNLYALHADTWLSSIVQLEVQAASMHDSHLYVSTA